MSVSTEEARAALDADKKARGQELLKIIERECQRLNCDLVVDMAITDGKIVGKVAVVAR